jgi:hypothetical protein
LSYELNLVGARRWAFFRNACRTAMLVSVQTLIQFQCPPQVTNFNQLKPLRGVLFARICAITSQ